MTAVSVEPKATIRFVRDYDNDWTLEGPGWSSAKGWVCEQEASERFPETETAKVVDVDFYLTDIEGGLKLYARRCDDVYQCGPLDCDFCDVVLSKAIAVAVDHKLGDPFPDVWVKVRVIE